MTIMTFMTIVTIIDKVINVHNKKTTTATKTILGLVTFETLITILTIKNLNSWQLLLPDNKEWHWTAFAILAMFSSICWMKNIHKWNAHHMHGGWCVPAGVSPKSQCRTDFRRKHNTGNQQLILQLGFRVRSCTQQDGSHVRNVEITRCTRLSWNSTLIRNAQKLFPIQGWLVL